LQTWDEKLAKYAQQWADKCKFGHGHVPDETKAFGGKWIGQNIYASWGRSVNKIGDKSTASWYGERVDYDLQKMSCNGGRVCGHFTQVCMKVHKVYYFFWSCLVCFNGDAIAHFNKRCQHALRNPVAKMDLRMPPLPTLRRRDVVPHCNDANHSPNIAMGYQFA
jgi:hypothetical protein